MSGERHDISLVHIRERTSAGERRLYTVLAVRVVLCAGARGELEMVKEDEPELSAREMRGWTTACG